MEVQLNQQRQVGDIQLDWRSRRRLRSGPETGEGCGSASGTLERKECALSWDSHLRCD